MAVRTSTTRTGKVTVHDRGKMALLALIIATNTLLLAIGRISEATWNLFTVAIVSFLLGNGLNAVKGKIGSPVLGVADGVPALLRLPTGAEVAVVPDSTSPPVGVDPSPWVELVASELVELVGLLPNQADTLAGELAAGTTPDELAGMGWGHNVTEAARLVLARHGDSR